MEQPIKNYKHNDKRKHIPSKEEAGYEEANPKVQEGNKILELPKNPVTHRGQDPELFWLNKYGNDDREELLHVDIRSLYRHEHIAPETLIRNLYKATEEKTSQLDMFASVNEIFGNALDHDELDKVSEYYSHHDGWSNRLIQGDSHLVMASLLEREGMAGQVQCIYIDPPYGIKYGSNWQVKLNNRDVKDGSDEALSAEPEQIKAFRDTWELGIHSYLSYLRDRLLIAKELLTESGSCFVQISDENVHLVRNIMDEVFGSENFVSQIIFQKTGYLGSEFLDSTYDYIIWYSKKIDNIKYRQLYVERENKALLRYNYLEIENGESIKLTKEQMLSGIMPQDGKRWRDKSLLSDGETKGSSSLPFTFNGRVFYPNKGKHWSTSVEGLEKLRKLNRIVLFKDKLNFKSYIEDFPVIPIGVCWDGMMIGTGLDYVVQTSNEVIQRCLLMCTDPGDLVLDPTCGSGTTAYVAEQWGRRWITIDTSRIALNIAKQRLMTAVFPYYKLYAETTSSDTSKGGELDVRQGFVYKTVPHITLKSLANDEPPATETLYDQPEIDKKRLRVSGPFTVETLQNYEPAAIEALAGELSSDTNSSPLERSGEAFEELIKQHLLSAGIKNGRKDEMVTFSRVELLSSEHLHAEGFYHTDKGEAKAYFHIGPKFGTVSKELVNKAIKECRQRGDADWLVIMGFSFDSSIEGGNTTTSMGTFEVTKCRMHDDLLQEGLKKKPAKSAASFVTIGEPDVVLNRVSPPLEGLGEAVTVEIQGLDIYDPIKDEIKARNLHDIAYWMVDDDYDGSNFVVKQVFFCGGSKDEFSKWRKGLDTLAKDSTKKKVEKTLKIEIDDEAFDRLYGFVSHPIEVKGKGHRIAVRLISQFGEESMKVLKV